MSLAAGTEVSVFLDGDQVRLGHLRDVNASGLAVRERHGASTIPRPQIARVATRTRIGTTRAPSIVKAAVGSAIVAGLFGAFVAAIGENGATKDDGVVIFAVGTLAGTALGAARAPAEKYEERLVYIRP